MFAILSLQYVSMATDGMGLNILTTESAEAKWQKKESKAFETKLVRESIVRIVGFVFVMTSQSAHYYAYSPRTSMRVCI